ncbi:MAG TPA: acyltransferase [Candidatus Saccharimonadales bacterium]
MALEGVRGLAAIIVVLHHFAFAFFPLLVLGTGTIQHMRLEDNIHGTPFALLFAGTFAVAIFFVLSGFVLTIGFFQTKKENIIKKLAAKRYLRLMLPALTITLICFVFIKLGFPQYIAKAASVTGSNWLSGESWKFDVHLFDALYSGTIGIFIEGKSMYDNVLWTMMTEFIGSFIVFGFALLFGNSKHRWICYIAAAILAFNTWYLPFIFGMALADLYATGRLERFRKRPWVIGGLVGAVFFGTYTWSAPASIYSSINKLLFANASINYLVLYLTVGATLLIFAVLMSKRLTSWLERPRVSVLGKYTFSLYLVHLPVLYTTGVLTFLALNSYLSYNIAVLITFLVNIPVVILATVLFERYVDAPAVKFSSIVARVFESGESIGIRKYALRIRHKIRKTQAILSRKPVEAIEEISVE